MRALIVDDEPLVRRALVRALRMRGHQVDEASDGQEGLDALERERRAGRFYDLLLVDVLMPRLKGPEMIQRWRSAGATEPTVVVVMSAFSGDLNVQDLFLSKPFDDIFSTVAQLEKWMSREK
jgi:CheY-like chemotaxis protein